MHPPLRSSLAPVPRTLRRAALVLAACVCPFVPGCGGDGAGGAGDEPEQDPPVEAPDTPPAEGQTEGDAPDVDPAGSGASEADVPAADAAAASEESPGTDWTTGLSEDGAYEVRWRVVDHGSVPMNEHFELELELFAVDGEERAPWEGATPEIRATMPEHRHGMLVKPVAEPLGDGRYRVPAMLFHMEGYWVLHVSARTGDGVSDIGRANFDIHI